MVIGEERGVIDIRVMIQKRSPDLRSFEVGISAHKLCWKTQNIVPE